MAIKKAIDIEINVDDKELGQVNEGIQEVGSSLDQLPGSAGAAVKGVQSLGMAFKALLANPIGLIITGIVGVLTGLYKVFERTAGGGDMLAKVFDGISAAIGPILDSLGRFADGLVSLLSGDFQEGLDKMRGSFDGIGASIKEAYQNAGRLVELRRELRDSSRELTVSESELRAQMELQRSLLDDIDLSIGKRIAANERLNELNKELLVEKQKLLDKQMEEAKLQAEQAGLDDDELQDAKDRIAELTAANNNAQAEKLRVDKEYVVKKNELNNQQRLLEEEERERQIEANKFTIEANSQKITDIQLQGEMELQTIKSLEDQKTEIVKKSLLEQKQALDATNALKIQATVDGLNILANLTSMFAGKSAREQKKAFNIQKAASLASATIQTYQSATAAFASQLIPGDPSSPIRGTIAATIAIASGLTNVARIASQRFNAPSTGGSGGSFAGMPQIGDSGGGAPSFNLVGRSGNNQLADIIGGAVFKTYVTSKDVTTAQELDRNVATSASFG